MTDRRRGAWRTVRYVLQAEAANAPQRACSAKPFPVVIAPAFDRRFAESLEQLVEARSRAGVVRRAGCGVASALAAAAQIAHHPAARFRDQPVANRRGGLRSHAAQALRLGHVPDELLSRAGAQWVVQHRQTQVEPRAEARDRRIGAFAQIALEHLFELGVANSPASQGLAILIFGQVRMTTEDVGRLLRGLAKRQVLERVQRVVVDEYGDRPLSWQQVRRVLDRLTKLLQLGPPIVPGIEGWSLHGVEHGKFRGWVNAVELSAADPSSDENASGYLCSGHGV